MKKKHTHTYKAKELERWSEKNGIDINASERRRERAIQRIED